MLAKGWLPPHLGSVLLDLDADRIVGNDGDTIASWANLTATGSGNNYAQSTGGLKPLIKRNIINGHSTLLFDGVDDVMTSAFLTPAAALPLTYFLVFKCVTAADASKIFIPLAFVDSIGVNTGTLFGSNFGYAPFAFINNLAAPGALSGSTTAVQNTSARLWSVAYNGGDYQAPGSYEMRLDGVTETLALTFSSSPGDYGAVSKLGSANGAFGVSMHVARLIVISGASVSEQRAIEKYLRNIYGI